MDFQSAVRSGFSRCFDFKTRSSRSEYWFWVLFTFIASIILSFIDIIALGAGDFGTLSSLFSLVTIIPSLAVGVRRLHDIDKTGWFILLGFIPIIGWLILIYWFCIAGDEEDNAYGANPLKLSSFEM